MVVIRLRSQYWVMGAPSMYSITKYGRPLVVAPASKIWAMFGWSIIASAWRSLLKRASAWAAKPRLLCSLVHKFGRHGVDNFDQFIRELEAQPSQAVGEIFVFVDECHRTESGKLHRVMEAILPNAVFIGFTCTSLLKMDKQTSLEVFGGYIHTYKFSEAVEDEVVLDLVYEARDIDQRLG